MTDTLGFVNSVTREQCRDCLAEKSAPADISDTRILRRLSARHLVSQVAKGYSLAVAKQIVEKHGLATVLDDE